MVKGSRSDRYCSGYNGRVAVQLPSIQTTRRRSQPPAIVQEGEGASERTRDVVPEIGLHERGIACHARRDLEVIGDVAPHRRVRRHQAQGEETRDRDRDADRGDVP